MIILGLQETDWLTRGPHTQHHIFERLSKYPSIKITVLDYDIDKILRSNSCIIKKQIYSNIDRTIENSKVKIIRTGHLQIPYFRRISSLITNFFEILKIIRKNQPDIIIGFSITNGLIGLVLAKIFKIPYIFYYIDILHTLVPVSYVKNLAKIASRVLLKYSDQVIVVTKLLQSYAISEGADHKNVKLLLNGISLENTIVNENKVEELRCKFSITKENFVIFFMGYLYKFAGLKEIIDYYHKRVKSGEINLKFVIVGDGGLYKDLLNYVKEIDANWVILTGKIPFFDISEYIELADLCLLSFKLNTITNNITPVKVMEYMAMKKPVLSNYLPSVVLEIGKNNGVIFAKNQKDLIKKIGRLSTKKVKLKELGQIAYDLVEQYYAWPKILKDLKKIIVDLIKTKRS